MGLCAHFGRPHNKQLSIFYSKIHKSGQLPSSHLSASASLLGLMMHQRCFSNGITSTTTTSGAEGLKTLERVYTKVPHRSLLLMKGDDSLPLLQGLTTNNMNILKEEHKPLSIFTSLLFPTGRVLADVIISPVQITNVLFPSNSVFIECDSRIVEDLLKHFKKWKLRAKIELVDLTPTFDVWAVLTSHKGDLEQANKAQQQIRQDLHDKLATHSFIDPRLDRLGIRVFAPKDNPRKAPLPLCF